MVGLIEQLASKEEERLGQERGLAGTGSDTVSMNTTFGSMSIFQKSVKIEVADLSSSQFDNPLCGFDGDTSSPINGFDGDAPVFSTVHEDNKVYPIMNVSKEAIAKWLNKENIDSWNYFGYGSGSQVFSEALTSLSQEDGREQIDSMNIDNGEIVVIHELPPMDGYSFSEYGIFNNNTGGELLVYNSFSPVTKNYDNIVRITIRVGANYSLPVTDELWNTISSKIIGSSGVVPSRIAFSNTEIVLDTTNITSFPGEFNRKEATSFRNNTQVNWTATLITSDNVGETIRSVGLFKNDSDTVPLMVWSGLEFKKGAYDNFQQIFMLDMR